ncbi:MAG: hypothetical protein WBM66_07930, partial [Thiothrix litoralis]
LLSVAMLVLELLLPLSVADVPLPPPPQAVSRKAKSSVRKTLSLQKLLCCAEAIMYPPADNP